MVVENVAWGPRGAWLVAARLFGWAVRLALLAVCLLCVLAEVEAWQAVGYPKPLQCLLCALGVVGMLAMLWLMATNPSEVQPDDVLHVPPREAVTWTWCSHCRLLRAPGAVHCFLCHRCIDGIHHHCAVLWRCVGTKTLPAFIIVLGTLLTVMLINCLMTREPTLAFRGGLGHFLIACILLFMLIHSVLSLDRRRLWSPPQVYSSSVFQVQSPHGHSGGAPFTFYFSDIPSRRSELLRMVFRPQLHKATRPEVRQVRDLLRCPNNKCQALANSFWLTGGSDGVGECNLCDAVFRLPQDMKGTLLDPVFLADKDTYCLLREGQARPRPRVVFVLDSSVMEARTLIHAWATTTHGLPDVEVLCYGTKTSCIYEEGKVKEEKVDHCHSLGDMVEHGLQEVEGHGGRLVFISSRKKHCLEVDALEALVVAASQVTVDVVSVSRRGLDMNPLLQPLVLYHQARGGGYTRVVERPKDVLRLVQAGLFLFWGVRAHGKIRWTPGVEVATVFGRGITPSQSQDADSFSVACLDQGKQVEFRLRVDPASVLRRRRLSLPGDNTAYLQLQIMYTTSRGRAALAVFNRAFSAT